MIRWECVEPGVVAVTIDNAARRNALDLEGFRALATLWPKLAHDPAIRVVIVTGAGDQAFCAGADLSANLTAVPDFQEIVASALLKLDMLPQPMIAAINGHCLAGGLELALAADIRIAARGAKFGLPEVKWGLIASAGGAMKLIDQIGHAAAMDLLLTGRFIDAERALRIGLVGEICDPAEVWPLALARAREIAGASPRAVRAAKVTALASRTARYAAQEAQEREIVAKLWASGDPQIGAAAFLGKHKPVYAD